MKNIISNSRQTDFFKRLLDPPSYGFEKEGVFYAPSNKEIFSEFFSRLNIFKTRKNWIPFFSWVTSLSLAIPLFIFFFNFFSWWLVAAGFVYSMIILGSHGTFWLHRYGTHRAYEFRNSFFREICRNLVMRILPEEVYIISHHVHHRYSEKPGDPYNVHGGFLYCFLADVNHQTLRKDLSEKEYAQMCRLMDHTGVKANTYSQYLKWGSIAHPFRTVMHFALSWLFWGSVFYLVGGPGLAFALMGSAGVWAFGVRTFNYEGHARGKEKQQDGIDFNRADLSINQTWPGYVSGEWHNNHHLYPAGARAGFLPYQLDIPWIWIYLLHKVGVVSGFRDFKKEFLRDHHAPYLLKQRAASALLASQQSS